MSSFFYPCFPSSAMPASDVTQISNVSFLPSRLDFVFKSWKIFSWFPLSHFLSLSKEFLILLCCAPSSFLSFYLHPILEYLFPVTKVGLEVFLQSWAEKKGRSVHALSCLNKIQFSLGSFTTRSLLVNSATLQGSLAVHSCSHLKAPNKIGENKCCFLKNKSLGPSMG